MGRAMLIFCAAALIAIGFINITTSKKGLSLVEQTVNYADFIMAKNAAHTAIQISMQKINKDDTWADSHSEGSPWRTTVNDRDVELYTVHNPSPDFWEPDELRMLSNAKHNDISVQVISQYLKEPFSSLVPDFEAALTVAADPDKFDFSMGGSSSIVGDGPPGHGCEDKPAISTLPGNSYKFDGIEEGSGSGNNKKGVYGDPLVYEDPDLSYQPTDELIARLANSPNVNYLNGNLSGNNVDMGSPENPGVFFVEDDLKITGGKIQGYGILVVRTYGEMEYFDEDGTQLDLAGNFEFNGLVIFENAYNFKGRGTPAINGSVLVGHTDDYPDGHSLGIDISGNITLQYDCIGENYAKMAAATAVEQYKYTRIVTSEGVNYFHDQPFN